MWRGLAPLLARDFSDRHRSGSAESSGHTYEKAGFAITSEPLNTRWGRAILMERWLVVGDSA